MGKQSSLNGSRLYCSIQTYIDEVFFSLVDYRNSRFTSENPDKIIEFYDSFKNRDDLIEWMKERPKGVANIYEVDGDKEIIVIIPTADFNGKYVKECKENIFNGLHMIFVESGGKGDFYFNYAHNCNVGIKKALEYNPKWVVVSNDDMYKIDEKEVLIKDLSRIQQDKEIVFSPYGDLIVEASKMARLSTVGRILTRILLNLKIKTIDLRVIENRIKFKAIYTRRKARFALTDIFFSKEEGVFMISGVFNIFRADFCKRFNGMMFDETFINGDEDTDLYLQINTNGIRAGIINYKIGNLLGKSLGQGKDRRLRSVASEAYLNYKRFK